LVTPIVTARMASTKMVRILLDLLFRLSAGVWVKSKIEIWQRKLRQESKPQTWWQWTSLRRSFLAHESVSVQTRMDVIADIAALFSILGLMRRRLLHEQRRKKNYNEIGLPTGLNGIAVGPRAPFSSHDSFVGSNRMILRQTHVRVPYEFLGSPIKNT
jgi:hypothetical protein